VGVDPVSWPIVIVPPLLGVPLPGRVPNRPFTSPGELAPLLEALP